MYPKAIEPYFAPTPTGLDIKREASRLCLNFGSLPHIRSFRIVRRIFQTDKPEILLRFAFIRESVLFRTRGKQRQRQPFGVSARNVFRGRSAGADGIFNFWCQATWAAPESRGWLPCQPLRDSTHR